jgi:hypothetical protein
VSVGGADVGGTVIRTVADGETELDALALGDGLVDVGSTWARWFPR